MSEIFRFSISEGLQCAERVVEKYPQAQDYQVSAEVVVQAALEQFGIEFARPIHRTPVEVLMHVPGMSPQDAERAQYDILFVLRRMLPWTEGPPMEDEKLIGSMQSITLSVTVVAREKQLAARDICDDYLPRRLRESFGFA